MKSKHMMRSIVIGALCVAVGAAAGIAGGSAATSSKSSSKAKASERLRSHLRSYGPGPFKLGGGPPVHSEAVVLNKARDGFITVTTDAGVVKSISGDEVTITEGTKTLTYKDATVTIPGDATARRNGSKAELGDLKAGDHVVVSRSSDGTFVGAFDSQHQPPFGGRRHLGPPPGLPGQPPPGLPGQP
jgi:hypothetical protein